MAQFMVGTMVKFVCGCMESEDSVLIDETLTVGSVREYFRTPSCPFSR
jgi:hypothetical protein